MQQEDDGNGDDENLNKEPEKPLVSILWVYVFI